MTYRVQMVKSPNITAEESDRRLAEVYRFLLDLAQRGETDDDVGDSGQETTEVVK